MVLGAAGFAVGAMNYVRDRPKLKVSVNWHMVEMGTQQHFGIVTATNVGRRPMFISAAVMEVPKQFKPRHYMLMESVRGQKLSEGDEPARFRINFDGMAQYSKVWREVRVYVQDSAGKKYYAPKSERVPPWVEPA
jgi:hypothetical protein